LPDEIINRPKTGFSIPVGEWLGAKKGAGWLRDWSLQINAPKTINAGRL
jgi:hypothetical protein